jgi:23S rRNA (cytidine1920-2'-O)/16S rRNA (cytidine1409-2'-O)-methyltransferase
VAEGLADNRSRAQALIRAGRVLVDDEPRDKPGQRVPDEARIRLRGDERRFVSRGGEKLAGALEDLTIEVRGRICLDVGASTGGFCDCLLQAGAASVVAVDVGYGQLDAGLRADPRVRVLERTNARGLTREDVPERISLVTVDVSFISVRLLLPSLARAAPGADLLVLVKPQFEVGRDEVGKGGVVRSDRLREAAAAGVRAAAEGEGYRFRGQADSRLPGPKGNREIFLWLTPARADEGGGEAAH